MGAVINQYIQIERVEKLLCGVIEDLTTLTEENFAVNFASAKLKMQGVTEIKLQNTAKINNFKPSKKIVQMAKHISDKYDNVTKEWANKLKVVQKEIELNQNQKKITIYNR